MSYPYHSKGSRLIEKQNKHNIGILFICFAIIILIISLYMTISISLTGFKPVFIILLVIIYTLNSSLFIIGFLNINKASRMPDEEPIETGIEFVQVKHEKKVSDAACPSCNAPLIKTPPCICEYCGRMIRNLKEYKKSNSIRI